jgi:hypothetical protein
MRRREPKWVPFENVYDLEDGDRVRFKHEPGEVYQVISNNGSQAVAINAVVVTNPPEWEVLD